MRRILVVGAMLLSLVFASNALAQSSFATVTGTVGDATGALIPGATITATNNATGVVTTGLSNESGTYNIPTLLPGVYKVSASLSGFQTQAFTDVELGNAAQIRLNFT